MDKIKITHVVKSVDINVEHKGVINTFKYNPVEKTFNTDLFHSALRYMKITSLEGYGKVFGMVAKYAKNIK